MRHLIVSSMLLTSSLGAGCATTQAGATASSLDNKAIVRELFDQGFGRGDRSVVERRVAERYIQHNPTVPDGREGLLGFMEQLGKMPQPPRVQVKRTLADGDLVLLHSDYDLGGKRLAVFDLFRLQDGLIVEHWDGMQEQPATTASGRTMLDGPTEPQDLEKTAANKQLVRDLVETVLVNGRFDQLPRFFEGDRYEQHNPQVKDGLSGLAAFVKSIQEAGISFRYHRLHRLVGEGNFVAVQSEGELGGKPTAFYDLFRVENGKIVEHWDVIQPIPEKMAHANGMF